MSKSWRIILSVVLIAVLLGGVCAGVGLITGGEWDRIHTALDARYHLDMYWEYAGDVVGALREAWVSPLAEPMAEEAVEPAVEPTVEPAA